LELDLEEVKFFKIPGFKGEPRRLARPNEDIDEFILSWWGRTMGDELDINDATSPSEDSLDCLGGEALRRSEDGASDEQRGQEKSGPDVSKDESNSTAGHGAAPAQVQTSPGASAPQPTANATTSLSAPPLPAAPNAAKAAPTPSLTQPLSPKTGPHGRLLPFFLTSQNWGNN